MKPRSFQLIEKGPAADAQRFGGDRSVAAGFAEGFFDQRFLGGFGGGVGGFPERRAAAGYSGVFLGGAGLAGRPGGRTP